jgi:hypothetical protein
LPLWPLRSLHGWIVRWSRRAQDYASNVSSALKGNVHTRTHTHTHIHTDAPQSDTHWSLSCQRTTEPGTIKLANSVDEGLSVGRWTVLEEQQWWCEGCSCREGLSLRGMQSSVVPGHLKCVERRRRKVDHGEFSSPLSGCSYSYL